MTSEIEHKLSLYTNWDKDMSLTRALKSAREFVRLHAGEKVTFDLTVWKKPGRKELVASYIDLAWGYNRWPEKIPNILDLIRVLKQEMPKARIALQGYVVKIAELEKNCG